MNIVPTKMRFKFCDLLIMSSDNRKIIFDNLSYYLFHVMDSLLCMLFFLPLWMCFSFMMFLDL